MRRQHRGGLHDENHHGKMRSIEKQEAETLVTGSQCPEPPAPHHHKKKAMQHGDRIYGYVIYCCGWSVAMFFFGAGIAAPYFDVS